MKYEMDFKFWHGENFYQIEIVRFNGYIRIYINKYTKQWLEMMIIRRYINGNILWDEKFDSLNLPTQEIEKIVDRLLKLKVFR